MSKNKDAQKGNQEKKSPKTPGKAPEVVKNSATKKPDDTATKLKAETVITKPETLLQRPAGGGALSADAKVTLLDLARRTFVEETRPHLAFPTQTQTSVNRIVACGILCAMADHIVAGDDTFAQVMQEQGYPSLVKAAEDLGFKLPDVKALPAGTEKGTVVLPAKAIEVPEDVKDAIKKEKEIRESAKPELDPTKISSDEEVSKALEYIFVSSGGKRLPQLLTESINFMKAFRNHMAEQAENTDEAKARFANYNSGDWLDDVFSYFTPPIFFSGIGRGMATVTDIEKSPIHAFIILRDAICDKETGKPVLEDQEIAYCVKSIVKWVCNVNIASNKKAIENLDPKKNKKEIEACEAQISKYNNVLAYITAPSSEEVDNLLENIGNHFDESGNQLTQECQNANATFNRICKTYYGKQLSDADYSNLNVNVQQYAGCILNLFRDAGSQLQNYKLSNITELQKRTEEERKQMLKKAKEEFEARKSKQKEEESKNG